LVAQVSIVKDPEARLKAVEGKDLGSRLTGIGSRIKGVGSRLKGIGSRVTIT
jgi:hypothetical protein